MDDLLRALFPAGHSVEQDGDVVAGYGTHDGHEIAVIGTANRVAMGVETALVLAGHVLEVLRAHPGRPILLLVDTQGQRLSRRDELLANNGYLAHLAKCLDLARRRGHKLVSLVYGEAVSGGFLAIGMIADQTYALPAANVRVMGLPAMSRITQIPLERLEELCQESPIFAPGVSNFLALGVVEDCWSGDLQQRLREALAVEENRAVRKELGRDRGGRTSAYEAAQRVREG